MRVLKQAGARYSGGTEDFCSEDFQKSREAGVTGAEGILREKTRQVFGLDHKELFLNQQQEVIERFQIE